MTSKKVFLAFLILMVLFIIGGIFRFYHIDFGLPQSWHADEPEFGELAIKYTYEFRNIIKNNDYYKLIPISYVYGTFPVYFLTLSIMAFSKFMNLLNFSFDKTTLYIFMRSLNAFLSLSIVVFGGLTYRKVFKDTFGTIFTVFFLALNWKLIVHAHYLNADIIITELLVLAFFAATYYYNNPEKHRYTIFLGILAGLAIGTKITAGLSLPLFGFLYAVKKDLRGFLAFGLIILGTYMVSNPFSFIFTGDFAFRITQMFSKEGGLVFDSIDTSSFKYLYALSYIANPLILGFSFYGAWHSVADKKVRAMHIFLLGNILIYLIFFSLGPRRVDRWLLPILPMVLVYAGYGFSKLKTTMKNARLFWIMAWLSIIIYLLFPILLLFQFKRETPKSAAYLWLKENTDSLETKLAITEEGLDPLNKLPSSTVQKMEVYESAGAHLTLPPNPKLYNYIILSSRPMRNFKKPEVIKKYPLYAKKWANFENEVTNTNKYQLIKSFVLPKPNLVELSDVYVYKNLEN